MGTAHKKNSRHAAAPGECWNLWTKEGKYVTTVSGKGDFSWVPSLTFSLVHFSAVHSLISTQVCYPRSCTALFALTQSDFFFFSRHFLLLLLSVYDGDSTVSYCWSGQRSWPQVSIATAGRLVNWELRLVRLHGVDQKFLLVFYRAVVERLGQIGHHSLVW